VLAFRFPPPLVTTRGGWQLLSAWNLEAFHSLCTHQSWKIKTEREYKTKQKEKESASPSEGEVAEVGAESEHSRFTWKSALTMDLKERFDPFPKEIGCNRFNFSIIDSSGNTHESNVDFFKVSERSSNDSLSIAVQLKWEQRPTLWIFWNYPPWCLEVALWNPLGSMFFPLTNDVFSQTIFIPQSCGVTKTYHKSDPTNTKTY
jgi:hypothetical protein